MSKYKMFNETGEYNKFFEAEEDQTEKAIDELIETDWSKDKESAMKALELIKGIILADNEKGKSFLKKIDNFTSNLKKD